MPADAASPRLLGGAAAGSDALVLGIETSCDETAAARVRGGTDVLSSVVSSQVDLHAKYGGVVPEIASRAHNELIIPVVARAMVEAGVDGRRIDAVAATTGPGLIGALLAALCDAGVPCRAQALPATLAGLHEKPLVLVRPDGHVALALPRQHSR
ncbi:MAG TPA: hypothetical protein PKC57_14855, partial [Microthrixaceae bacterium]|nr:hypothetical protein [Microthrixaceae bacterium]